MKIPEYCRKTNKQKNTLLFFRNRLQIPKRSKIRERINVEGSLGLYEVVRLRHLFRFMSGSAVHGPL